MNRAQLDIKYRLAIVLLSVLAIFPSLLPTYIAIPYLAEVFGMQEALAYSAQENYTAWFAACTATLFGFMLINIAVTLYFAGQYFGCTFTKSLQVFIKHDYPEKWYKSEY